MAVDGRAVVIEQHWIAHRAHLAQPRMLDILDDAAGDHVRIVEHFLEIVDAGARHATAYQSRLDLARIARAHRGLDHRQQRCFIGPCDSNKTRSADR